MSPDDNIGGVDEDALIDAEETGYEDIENDSDEDNSDW